jgi:hypothetical protein
VLKRLSILLVFGISILYLTLLGPSSILHILGWSSILVPSVWFGLAVMWLAKMCSGRLFLYVLIIGGYLLLNHMAMYIQSTIPSVPVNHMTVFLGGLFLLPILLPYAILMHTIVQLHRATQWPHYYIYTDASGNFQMAHIYGLVVSVVFLIPFLVFTETIRFFPFWLIILIIFSSLITYGQLRKVNSEEIECIIRFFKRAPHLLGPARVILASFLLISLLSIILEYFRGMWLFAILCWISLFVLTANLWKVYKHIFMPKPEISGKIESISILIRWSPKLIILTCLAMIFYYSLFIFIKVGDW